MRRKTMFAYALALAMACWVSYGWFDSGGAVGQEQPSPPRVQEVLLQSVGNTTYFSVRLADVPGWPPERWAELSRNQVLDVGENRPLVPVSLLAGAPRLVPQDDVVESVYLLWPTEDLNRAIREIEGTQALPAKPLPNQPAPAPAPARGLTFVGRLRKTAPAKFLLVYTALQEQNLPHPFRDKESLKLPWPTRREIPLTVDFSQATRVAPPKEPARHAQVEPNDLEGLFALGRGQFFALQAWLTHEQGTGFYEFARIMNNRRYGTTVGSLNGFGQIPGRDQELLRRQFELVTGAAAIAETLQIQRLQAAGDPISKGPRTVDVRSLPTIDIPEVVWEQLLRGKEPEIEPLAHLVPRDHYYVHFSNFGRFLEAGDLLEQWGGPILQALRLAGQDYRLRQKYERQLCLKSTALAKIFGPAVVEHVAITGSDLYFREGTDVTVLFQVKNLPLFLAAVNTQIAEARKVYGDRLQESKAEYQGVAIESFVAPRREVSAYRCVLDDKVVVYSNSPVAIRRIIDTAKKKLPALADAKDFRYMRTVFRWKDPQEDTFLFFSDTFLRELLGPVKRIQESRRTEALASLYMLHHAAIYAAWETGQLPRTHEALLAQSGLKASELYQPEGKELRWDGEAQVAVSDVYNTIHFATPLIELPLDRVTEREADAYRMFRFNYIRLWTAAFDPVAFRLQIRPERIVAETYILPLINSLDYRRWRQNFGGKVAKFDLNLIPPEGILYWLVHFSETSWLRQALQDLVRPNLGPKIRLPQAIGEIALLGVHDDATLAEIAQDSALRYLLGKLDEVPEHVWIRRTFSLPIVAGLEVKNPLMFAGVLAALKALVDQAAPQLVTWQMLEQDQHGYKIVAIRPVAGSWLDQTINPPGTPEKDRFTPGIYYTTVGNMFYVSLREDVIRQLIDRHVAKKKEQNGKPEKPNTTEGHMVLYLSPANAKRLWPVALWALETQIASSAVTSSALLYPLWRARIVPADARHPQLGDVAYRLYGFAPVSPDGTNFVYNASTDQVTSERHGAITEPWFPRQPATDCPAGQLLQSLRSLRAELQFREDGAFTVLTIERQAPAGR
jgi:hypothetical protein